MKKFIVFSVMFGLLSGVVGVVAVDQPIEVIIGADINLEITPPTLDFGSILPDTLGNAALNGPIGFDAAGSNVDVNVEITGVTGFPFETGLMLDGTPALLKEWDLECVIVSDLCTYSPASTVPTLDVPLGAAQGAQAGTIEYTVTGTPPI